MNTPPLLPPLYFSTSYLLPSIPPHPLPLSHPLSPSLILSHVWKQSQSRRFQQLIVAELNKRRHLCQRKKRVEGSQGGYGGEGERSQMSIKCTERRHLREDDWSYSRVLQMSPHRFALANRANCSELAFYAALQKTGNSNKHLWK